MVDILHSKPGQAINTKLTNSIKCCLFVFGLNTHNILIYISSENAKEKLIFHIDFQAHEYVDKFRSLITTVKQFHPNLMFLVRFNKKIDFMQR